jgi:hypothetical protein
MGHAGLIAHEGSQMNRLFGIILNKLVSSQCQLKNMMRVHLGESLDLSTVTGRPLSRQKT